MKCLVWSIICYICCIVIADAQYTPAVLQIQPGPQPQTVCITSPTSPSIKTCIPIGTLNSATGIFTPVATSSPTFNLTGYIFGNGINPATSSLTIPVGSVQGLNGNLLLQDTNTWTGVNTFSTSAIFLTPPAFVGLSGPLFGNGANPIFAGTVSGNTTKLATVSGAFVSGDCIKSDSNGNAVDAGSPCGTSSGTVGSSTANNLAYYAVTGSNITGLSSANNGVLVTSNTGVPSISSTLPAATQLNITQVGTLTAGTLPASFVTGTLGSVTPLTGAIITGNANASTMNITDQGGMTVFSTDAFKFTASEGIASFSPTVTHYAFEVRSTKNAPGSNTTGSRLALIAWQLGAGGTSSDYFTAGTEIVMPSSGSFANNGNFTGNNPYCLINAGMTPNSCVGEEVDVTTKANVANIREGIRVVDVGSTGVYGGGADAAIGIVSSGIGFANGLFFGDTGGSGFPIPANGDLINTVASSNILSSYINLGNLSGAPSLAGIVLPQGVTGIGWGTGSTCCAGGEITSNTTSNGQFIIFGNHFTTVQDNSVNLIVTNPPASGGVQLVGTTSGNPQGVTYVGEIISANVVAASAIGQPVSGTPINVAAINLSAGNWLCSGSVWTKAAATTVTTALEGGMSPNSATFMAPPDNGGMAFLNGLSVPASGNVGLTTAVMPFSVTTLTTLYLVGDAIFATSTMALYGNISCERYM